MSKPPNVQMRLVGKDQKPLVLKMRIEPLTDTAARVIAELAALNLGAPSFKEKYEKAYFGEKKLRGSKEMKFLTTFRDRLAIARENKRTLADKKLVALLAPITDALNKLDVRFFKNLAEAVRILELRSTWNKNREPTTLDKWLLDYAMQNGWELPYTTREFNEQVVSKVRAISNPRLRRRCNKLGISLKDGRGRRHDS
jgi:hypothetical protein